MTTQVQVRVRSRLTGFGNLLKCHRLVAGLTQEALAGQAGLSVRAISDLERGINRTPHTDTLRMLAGALHLSPADQSAFVAVAHRQGESSFDLLQGRSATHSDGDLPPFMGRERELALLAHYLEGDGPPLLLFAGEPGRGKSRLLWEVAHGAVGYGFRVLEGECHRSGREPYDPMLGVLTSYMQVQPSAQLRRDLRGCGWLVRLLPELPDNLLESPSLALVPPEQERRLMFDAVVRFLTNIAGPAGTLLVLDDLQWAGADALELLAVLVRTSGMRLRIVGTYRQSEIAAESPLAILIADLIHQGLAGVATLEPLTSARVVHPLSTPHSLPTSPSPLVGRANDVAAIAHLLREEDVRLLTLTGPGGVGKTHLALHVAAGLADLGPDGLFFVPLAPLGNPVLVANTIAGVVGLRDSAGRSMTESLVAHLRESQILLLLDNFEHLLSAAGLISRLLADCSRLKLLVTSQAALHLREEHEYPVAPLALPDPAHLPAVDTFIQYPAVNLFVRRARAIRPDFRVTSSNASAVAQICMRLDGLPLALELAAARIKLLPPHALLARLANTQGGASLQVLSGGARDLPLRLQTMRGALAWSYDLLRPAEQALFRRLAVFSGGGTVAAIEAVCAIDGDLDVLDGLAELVDHSLLRSEEQSEDGDARITMLETVRQYGLECLMASGEEDTIRRQHAIYYLDLVEKAVSSVNGPRQTQWLAWFDAEANNLRTVVRWVQERSDATMEWCLASSLWYFWYARGFLNEARAWLERLLADDSLEAHDEVSAGIRAKVLRGAASLAWHQGDFTQAAVRAEECLAAYEQLGDKLGICVALSGLGVVVQDQGDLARAEALYTRSHALAHELGDAERTAVALNNLADSARARGDYDRAVALWQECLAVCRAWGATSYIGLTLEGLGEVFYLQGDCERAESVLREALVCNRDTASRIYAASSMEVLAQIACTQGQMQRAARLFGGVAALRKSVGAVRPPDRADDSEHAIAIARAALSEKAFAAAWAAGAAMTLEEAVAYAMGEAD